MSMYISPWAAVANKADRLRKQAEQNAPPEELRETFEALVAGFQTVREAERGVVVKMVAERINVIAGLLVNWDLHKENRLKLIAAAARGIFDDAFIETNRVRKI